MSNRFFDWVASASRFISYTWARASEVNASLDNVSTGFELVQDEIDENKTRSIRLPVGQDGDITAVAADRARRVLTFNASGLPYIFPPDDAAVRADKVFAWDSSGNPILASNGAPYAWLPNQTGNADKILTTNGSAPSWLATALTLQSGHSGKFLGTNGTVDSWSYPIPTGTTARFPIGVTPTGWLACDGADPASATYPSLSATLLPTFTPEVFSPFSSNWQTIGAPYVSGAYIWGSNAPTYRYSDDHGATWKSVDATSNFYQSFPGDGFFYKHKNQSMYRASTPGGTYTLISSDSDLSDARQDYRKVGSNYISRVSTSSGPVYSADMVTFTVCSPSAGAFSTYSYLCLTGTTLYGSAHGGGVTTLEKSTDGGATWTSPSTIDAGAAKTGMVVVMNGTAFLAFDLGTTNAYTATSDAGPWTAATLPATQNYAGGIVGFGGYFWSSVGTTLHRSTTGATGTWTNVTPVGSTLNNCPILVTNAGTPRLYLLNPSRSSPDASTAYVQWTTDGTNWTTEWSPGISGYTGHRGSVKVGSNYVHAFYGMGVAPVYSTTPGGFCSLSSTTTVSFTTSAAATIASDGTNAYIIGRAAGSNYLYKTTNGTTWSVVGAAIGTMFTSNMVWGGGNLFAASTTLAYISNGTVAFATNAFPGTFTSQPEVNYVAGRYVAYDSSTYTTLYVSADGSTWLTRVLPVAGKPVVGDPAGAVMYCGGYLSTDYGAHWEVDPNPIYPYDFPENFYDDGTSEISLVNGVVTGRKKSSGMVANFPFTTNVAGNEGRMMKDGSTYYFFQSSYAAPTYMETSLKVTVSSATFRMPTIANETVTGGKLKTWMYAL